VDLVKSLKSKCKIYKITAQSSYNINKNTLAMTWHLKF